MRFLFVDRILALGPRLQRGLKQVSAEDYYLSQDGSGRLVFIPSLIGETLGQLAAWAVIQRTDFKKRPVAGVVATAELLRPVYPGDCLYLEAEIDALDETSVRYQASAFVGEDCVFRVQDALGPLLDMADFIDEAEVRQQFAEIYRPGDWQPQIQPVLESFLPKTPALPAIQFDQILAYTPGQSLVAAKLISRAAPYFADHFPRRPVLPMTVLLEALCQLLRAFLDREGLAQRFKLASMRKIKMNEFVSPGDRLQSQLQIKSLSPEQCIITARSEVLGKRVCVLEFLLEGLDAK